MTVIFYVLNQFARIQDLEQKPSDFPDNPSDDYDQDGLRV